jgi:hypothetical protein
MRILVLAFLLLAGCSDKSEAPQTEWRCIGGKTHEKVNGAWVQLDGHPYLNFRNGPIPCSEVPPADTGEKQP